MSERYTFSALSFSYSSEDDPRLSFVDQDARLIPPSLGGEGGAPSSAYLDGAQYDYQPDAALSGQESGATAYLFKGRHDEEAFFIVRNEGMYSLRLQCGNLEYKYEDQVFELSDPEARQEIERRLRYAPSQRRFLPHDRGVPSDFQRVGASFSVAHVLPVAFVSDGQAVMTDRKVNDGMNSMVEQPASSTRAMLAQKGAYGGANLASTVFLLMDAQATLMLSHALFIAVSEIIDANTSRQHPFYACLVAPAAVRPLAEESMRSSPVHCPPDLGFGLTAPVPQDALDQSFFQTGSQSPLHDGVSRPQAFDRAPGGSPPPHPGDCAPDSQASAQGISGLYRLF